MNNNNKLNYIIFFVLSFAIILGYSVMFPPPKQTPKTDMEQKPADNLAVQSDAPSAQTQQTQQAPSSNIFDQPADKLNTFEKSENLITVKTDLFTGKIDPLGGRIAEWQLQKYNEKAQDESIKYNLFHDAPPGFNVEVATDTIVVPNPIPYKYSGPKEVVVKDSQEQLMFSWQSQKGLEITKVYTIDPKSYLVSSTLTIENNSANTIKQQIKVNAYSKDLQVDNRGKGKEFIAYVSDEVLKETSTPEEKKQFTGSVSWFGFLDKYFLYTFLPESSDVRTLDFYSLNGDSKVAAVYSYPVKSIKPGSEEPYKSKLYLGPLDVNALAQAGPDLKNAMNFGWMDILAKPVLSLLNYLNKYFNNYGISIIVITILIRLVFLPLTIKSMASMKEVQVKMQALKPKLDALKEKYKDDKAQQNAEMMKLYSSHGVNPLSSLGGCLPMLVQIPVFIALYEVLLNSIDLRHSEFLWIHDLSEPEMLFDIPGIGIPFRILPLAMGVSWFISQKMTPTTAPGSEQMELQMKMMQFMPIIFTVMFWGLPSGLVLYWTVSNILSVAQQMYVNRKTATH